MFICLNYKEERTRWRRNKRGHLFWTDLFYCWLKTHKPKFVFLYIYIYIIEIELNWTTTLLIAGTFSRVYIIYIYKKHINLFTLLLISTLILMIKKAYKQIALITTFFIYCIYCYYVLIWFYVYGFFISFQLGSLSLFFQFIFIELIKKVSFIFRLKTKLE